MKIYIAAPFAARELVASYARVLTSNGHTCTSTWASSTREIQDATLGPSWATSDKGVAVHALDDLKDVLSADALIMLTAEHVLELGVPDRRLHTGGRHTELGYALAAQKLVAVVGTPENIFQRGLCATADTFMRALELLTEVKQMTDMMKAEVGPVMTKEQALQVIRTYAGKLGNTEHLEAPLE